MASREPINMSIIGNTERPKNTWVCAGCGCHNVNTSEECELCGCEK